MAIVRGLPETPSFGKVLATGIGSGLSQGLQGLAALKAQELQQRQQQRIFEQGISGIRGMTPQAARFLSALSPAERKEMWPNLPALMGLFGPQGAAQAPQGIAPQASPEFQQWLAQSGIIPGQEGAAPITGQPQPVVSPLSKGYEEAFTSPAARRAKATEKREEEKLGIAKETLAEKKQTRIDKAFASLRKDIYEKGKTADETLDRLKQQEELVKTGDLSHPLIASTLETLSKGIFGIGIDLFGTLTSGDTQKMRSLSLENFKVLKSIFGARPTQAEAFKIFNMYPSLFNSKEGNLALIERSRPLVMAQKAELLADDEIMEEYGQKTPKNYKSLLKKHTEQIKNKLWKEYLACSELPLMAEVNDPTITGLEVNGLKFKKGLNDWELIEEK